MTNRLLRLRNHYDLMRQFHKYYFMPKCDFSTFLNIYRLTIDSNKSLSRCRACVNQRLYTCGCLKFVKDCLTLHSLIVTSILR